MKVTAMVHSKEKREEVELLEKRNFSNGGQYLVRTNDGVLCTAIFNPYVCLYYADDLYGVINKED